MPQTEVQLRAVALLLKQVRKGSVEKALIPHIHTHTQILLNNVVQTLYGTKNKNKVIFR